MPTFKNPGPDALLVPSLGLRVEAGDTVTADSLPCPPFEAVVEKKASTKAEEV